MSFIKSSAYRTASDMITERTLLPGDPGSKKLIKKYGDALICVRYRLDRVLRKKIKTVELIVEEKPYQFKAGKIPWNKRVKIKINYGEKDLGLLTRNAGGVWNRKEKVWELPYHQFKALGLTHRMIK